MDVLTTSLAGQGLSARNPWNAATERLVCLSVHDEGPEVKTFTFAAEGGGYFNYMPGQFVTLELPVAEEILLRTYTIASSPSRPFSIAVTVKAQATSIGTRWMFDHVFPGSRIKAAHGPLGRFTFALKPAEKYLFVSAGSGITPMMSMLRWLADCEPLADVVFIANARQPEEILFRAELELLAARMPNLALGFIAEARPAGSAWHGLTGRIDGQKLSLLAPDFLEREAFCCGPEPFMRAVGTLLADAGFHMESYHQESFGPSTLDEVNAPAAPAAGEEAVTPEGHAIRFSFTDAEGLAIPGQTLLQVARAVGVRIPAACESGLCGTCKVMKTAGEVEMSHNGGILDDEIEEGYVLACCSRPLSAVEIEA